MIRISCGQRGGNDLGSNRAGLDRGWNSGRLIAFGDIQAGPEVIG
jgi:hypothetical protein